MIQYELDLQIGLLRVQATGCISVADRESFVDCVVADASLPNVLPVLIDVTRLTKPPSPQDIPGMAVLADRLASRFNSRIAYVVVQSTYVLPYVLTAITASDERCEIRTFSDRKNAEEWLIGNSRIVDG